MMKLLTKTTALLLGVGAILVLASPARGAEASRGFQPGNEVVVSRYCESEKTISRLVGYLAMGRGDKATAYFNHPDTDCYTYFNAEDRPIMLPGVSLRVVSDTPGPRGKIRFIVVEVRVNYDGSVVFAVAAVPVVQEPALKDTKGWPNDMTLGDDQRDV